jgi:hypothetical protein
MPLRSRLFSQEPKLEDCLARDSAHITLSTKGFHVVLIQDALRAIDALVVDPAETESQTYGPSTAAAVLSYKSKRSIINRSYQSSPDNIVGKMTIKSLDDDLLRIEDRDRRGGLVTNAICSDRTAPTSTSQTPRIVAQKGITLPDDIVT